MPLFLLTAALPLLNPSTTIWSQTPATHYIESSVLGNGRLGAMVFGGIGRERVVLNESTMWSGSPQDADREDAHKVLPRIRELLLRGDNEEASRLVQENFVCKGPGSGGAAYGRYQTFGDLVVQSPEKEFTDYRRVLDLDRAVTTVTYRSGGVNFIREAFTSAPAQTFAYRYRADRKGKIAFDARLTRPEGAVGRAEGSDYILEGQLDSGNPSIPGVQFNGRLRVSTKGGSVRTDNEGIHVEGADEATLVFSADTSMFDGDFAKRTKNHVDTASGKSFTNLEQEHVKDYQRFFRRVDLRLPEGASAHKPTLERLQANKNSEDDPSLAALYFNFGRYLLIGSSRPDSPLPANLQGIWGDEINTPWNGDFHLNINVQMNYWPAEVTNLSDCHRPLLNFIPRLVENGRKTAEAYYDADGWVVHTITNPWLFTSPGEGASWGSAITSGAWLCEHLWDHYAFTGDKAYLRSVYPTMKGAAEFFLDMLIEEPKHGWLVTAPSNSPENAYIDPKTGKGLAVTMGPTIDMEILRELFTNTIEATKVLNVDPEFRTKLEASRARLAPFQIGKHGQLQEWLEDYDEQDPHHRHVSHLYGLHPGDQISPDRTPDLAKAARVTLERRGDDGVGWSLAWKACFWARLHDGDHAWRLVKLLLHPVTDTSIRYDGGGGAYPNLLDASPPFQIDGNFGGTAAIAEMLLQSVKGEIRLLPALPKAWASGSVKGLKARGNLTVDIVWKDGRVTDYKLTGPGSKNVKVRLPQD
ncbi:glycoside hydrolase family 95 protein [bacterium]|nr:MAG: glycoside hydrolase family 95 protein [bacterium]